MALLACHTGQQKADEQPRHPSVHKHPRTSAIKKKNRGRRPRSTAKRERRTSFGNPHEQPRHRWPKPIHRLLEKQLSLEVPGGPTPFKGDLKKGAFGSPWGPLSCSQAEKKRNPWACFSMGSTSHCLCTSDPPEP